jgi:two-component system nitrogen regulation sensor histidine kinase NtrY
LTPIQLSTEHVRTLLHDRGVLPLPEIDACLDTIVRKVRELRDISGAFSTYAKLPDLVLARVDLAGSCARSSPLSRRAAAFRPRGGALRRHPSDPADRVILGRAILNLIENALQAMPSGGTLRDASSPAIR